MPAAGWFSLMRTDPAVAGAAFAPLVVIPVYDHEHAIAAVVDGVQSVIPIQYGEKQACIQQSRHAERPQPLSRWTPCLKISSARAEAWP